MYPSTDRLCQNLLSARGVLHVLNQCGANMYILGVGAITPLDFNDLVGLKSLIPIYPLPSVRLPRNIRNDAFSYVLKVP